MLKVVSRTAQATPATQRSALRQFFADMFARIQEGREIATRYYALTRMSPSELASRGLSQQDVAHVALTGIPLEPQQQRH